MAVIFRDPGPSVPPPGFGRTSARVARGQAPQSPVPQKMALGRILLERSLVTETQLDTAIAHQKRSGDRLGQVLVDLGYTTADMILAALQDQLNVATTRVNANTVSAESIPALPEKDARKHTALLLC